MRTHHHEQQTMPTGQRTRNPRDLRQWDLQTDGILRTCQPVQFISSRRSISGLPLLQRAAHAHSESKVEGAIS